MRHVRLLLCLGVLLLAGCGQQAATPQSAAPGTAAQPTAEIAAEPTAQEENLASAAAPADSAAQSTNTFAASGSSDPVVALVDKAAQDIDTFWRQQFEQIGAAYDPPSTVQAYTADAPVETACGESVPGNAFYCPRDNGIYYDRDLLAAILDKSPSSDFGVITVIAHEWGHLAQAQLPRLAVPRLNVRVELQADCFAGGYGRYIADGSSAAFTRSRGDLLTAAATLFSFGDQLPWFNPQAHGTPKERAQAYGEGLSALESCRRGN